MRSFRKQTGNITEFAAAFTVFLSMALPLLNISFVPIRYLFCQAIVSDLANSLAHCEKRSDADKMLRQDQSWKSKLANFGVTVENERLEIIATTSDGKAKLILRQGQSIPAEWLPNDPKGPFIYSLALRTSCRIAPAVGADGGIPGLSGPITLPVSGVSQWENVSPNPKNTRYFIEE
ncbi:MAG: hypothetical protein K2W95_29030 [Candidatus Obscuribacterales bacterium]|nr:hypothetical protein [Candidatus Obscuribacterales bacterium]